MKLLIARFSSIGDCVMAVPAASVFRRADPDGLLVWAIDPRCEAVVEGSPRLVSSKFFVPWETWKRERVPSLARLRHYMKLRAFRFDVGVDLQGHSKTAICLRLAGARKRITLRPIDPLAKLLNPSARVHREHRVEQTIELFEQLGIHHANAAPIMPSPLPPPPGLAGAVSIAVSTGHPKKNLPADTWAQVASGLLEAGETVVFVGGPGDEAPSVPGAHDYCGKLSLAETMGILASSRLHIAGDTGSGHISAAYGVSVISIFGPTKAREFRPYGLKTRVLQADDKMRGIGADQILQAAREVLACAS